MSWSSSSPSSSHLGSSPDPPRSQSGRPITARHHLEPVNPIRRSLFQDLPDVPANTPLDSWQPLAYNQQSPQQGCSSANVMEYRANYGFRPGRECKFCKNNGETSTLYRSHVLRDPQTGKLICPVLRSHVCEICGGTQDNAHTRNYCPKLKEEKKLKLALPVTLKKTKRQSDGQMRQ